ncbi:MAG: shikimate kinase [Cyanobacteria bacterium J06635_15]
MTQHLKGTNLYLIGMMGAGKSTVGKQLAQQLDYRFFDTDTLVEQVSGQTIPQIFADQGETAFRELETAVLAQLAPYTRLVVATGGGIVLKPKNWSYLHHGVVVWLDAPLSVLEQRLTGDHQRPLLQTEDLSLKLETLMAERQSLYRQADIRIGINQRDQPKFSAEQILVAVDQLIQTQATPTVPPEIEIIGHDPPNSH